MIIDNGKAASNLRSAIDAEPFTEIEFFKPDLDLPLPGANDSPAGGKGLNKVVTEKLREHYQRALLHFIRHPEEVASAHIMRDIAGALARNAKSGYVRKFWSIANAFLELLPADAQNKPAYKLLAGRLDAPLRTLATQGESALTPTLYNNRLLRELLLEIAHSEQKSESLEQIRSIFSLHAWIGKNPTVPDSSQGAGTETLHSGSDLAATLATTLLDWEQNRGGHASALQKRLESVIQFCSENQNPQVQQLATQSVALLAAINTKPDSATQSVLATLSRTIHRVIYGLNPARQTGALVKWKSCRTSNRYAKGRSPG